MVALTSEDVIRIVRRMVSPLTRRVALLMSRAVVKLVDDSLQCQGLQVSGLAGELQDEVEHWQPYGFTAVPRAGAEGIYLSLGGSRNRGVVVCIQDRELRLKGLEEGEVVIYDDQGSKVHLRRDGLIEIVGKEVRVGAPDASKGAAREGDKVKVTIPPGTFIEQVTGGAGAPAVGVPNTAPVELEGEIVEGSLVVKVAD